MKKLVAPAALALALAGCASVDDIRQRPVVFSATYAAPYDRMANCVAAKSIYLFASATPFVDTTARRAEVLQFASSGGNMIARYEFRDTGAGSTEVTYQLNGRTGRVADDSSAPKLLRECAG